MDKSGPIFLITGTPGSGKSSVSTPLMRRFEFGLHIPLDDLREWVVAGIAHPVPEWTEETTRQFRLARQSAVKMAQLYANEGFAVAIDDVLFENVFQEVFADNLADYTIYKILLLPGVKTALERNAARQNKDFDTSVLIETIKGLHEAFSKQNRPEDGWLILNNAELNLDQTVDEILRLTARK